MNLRFRRLSSAVVPLVLALLSLAASAARSDTVILTDGDKLTGKITALVDGKLTINVAGVGDVKIDTAKVSSFSTDAPVVLKLKDDTLVTQQVAIQPGGMIQIGGGLLGPHALPTTDVVEINPPVAKWSGSLQAGGIFVRGNAETDSLNLAANLERKTDQDKIALSGNYLYGRTTNRTTDQSFTTAENWQTEALYDYYFTKQFYGFLDAQVTKDRIAYLDLRFAPSAGVGYIFFNGPKLNLSTEGGLAWIYERYTNDTATREDVSLRLAYHVSYKFYDNVTVFHDLEYFPSIQNGRNYIVNTDIGLRAKLTTHVFAEAKAVVDFDSDPARNAFKTNTTMVFDLGYTI
jgi:putative salt-induced outer membrane protein YdiY